MKIVPVICNKKENEEKIGEIPLISHDKVLHY
jgi:hypothetical protein